jgi:hypothetical protein
VRQRNAGTLAEAAERLSLRVRAARLLFGFAVALEREEIWRVVWERLEAPGDL